MDVCGLQSAPESHWAWCVCTLEDRLWVFFPSASLQGLQTARCNTHDSEAYIHFNILYLFLHTIYIVLRSPLLSGLASRVSAEEIITPS